ncbi:MAG TPA: glycosyltransferase family 2 protein [Methylococcales bacterium]|nr:glycosyltransferase family 2 protein [Methylococcales bacterium]
MSSSSPHIAILLCTYNGEKFLKEQLDSIITQDYDNFSIWVSDDGSKDQTISILRDYQANLKNNRFSIISGPQVGFAQNFLSLLCNPDIVADYFSFADQDDIWAPNKLSRAVNHLKIDPSPVPLLYCSRTYLIDEIGNPIGLSPLFRKKPSFTNALVQNIGGGNTMVLNKAAISLLRSVGTKPIPSHDSWSYMLITGAGGTVIYDSTPTTYYRQHSNNIVGSNHGLQPSLIRIKALLDGQFSSSNTTTTQILLKFKHLLTPENHRTLEEFSRARNRWLIPRIWGVLKSGVYRQTFTGNLGIIVATLLNKL